MYLAANSARIRVYNGLKAISKKTGTVVVHDAVRPFIQLEELKSCILGSRKFGACILGVPVSDTVKRVGKSGFIKKTLIRNNIWLAQTPQAFKYELIIRELMKPHGVMDIYRL